MILLNTAQIIFLSYLKYFSCSAFHMELILNSFFFFVLESLNIMISFSNPTSHYSNLSLFCLNYIIPDPSITLRLLFCVLLFVLFISFAKRAVVILRFSLVFAHMPFPFYFHYCLKHFKVKEHFPPLKCQTIVLCYFMELINLCFVL